MRVNMTTVTQNMSGVTRQKVKRRVIFVVAALFTCLTIAGYAEPAYANQYDERIKALQSEITTYQQKSSELKDRSTSLQTELAQLTNDKQVIQSQINLSQAKSDKLTVDIASTKKRIVSTQDILGDLVAERYIAEDTSPLEMLASSQSIGDYIDQSTYRSSVSEQLNQKIGEIKKLKSSLETQKSNMAQALQDNKNAVQALQQKESEKQTLLTQTKGEEAAYQKLAGDRQVKANSLRDEQIAANARAAQSSGSQTLIASVMGGGNYPAKWANTPMNALVDNWGLYNRQCVSYTAWKVASTGRFVPHFGGRGNANQWETTTAPYGIKSGSNPVVGSVAVLYQGYYGHTMYVEAVSQDKSRITISEYNYGWSGMYSKRTISSNGLRYIYF